MQRHTPSAATGVVARATHGYASGESIRTFPLQATLTAASDDPVAPFHSRIGGSMKRCTFARTVLALLTISFVGAGCTSARSGSGSAAPRASSTVVVIGGDELWRAGGGLLEGLRGRLSAMQVTRPSGAACPVVHFRGHRTLYGSVPPVVYVNGTRMLDTCVLDQIRVPDIERVEIHRGAVTGATGTAMSANGMISIYLRTGRRD
jgi:hypothetical protein